MGAFRRCFIPTISRSAVLTLRVRSRAIPFLQRGHQQAERGAEHDHRRPPAEHVQPQPIDVVAHRLVPAADQHQQDQQGRGQQAVEGGRQNEGLDQSDTSGESRAMPAALHVLWLHSGDR